MAVHLIALTERLEFLNISKCNLLAKDTASLVNVVQDLKLLKYLKIQENFGNINIYEVVQAVKFCDRLSSTFKEQSLSSKICLMF